MSKPRIFLNYAREDQPQVRKLYRKLKWHGGEPWMDLDIEPGAEWPGRIRKAIRQADFFLACISTRSVEKSGVIVEEIETALKIRAEESGAGMRVIPVCLDKVELPPSLADFQAVDVFGPGGWPRLRDAMGLRRWSTIPLIAGAAVLAVAAIIAVALFALRPSYPSKFVEARLPGDTTADQAFVGVTISELRRSVESDPPGVRMLVEPSQSNAAAGTARLEWTPVRRSADAVLKNGARVRLAFETTRSGFLYVVDREQRKGNRSGEPALVFPTERTRGSGNEVRPGQLFVLPRPDAEVQYWEMQRQSADYVGEVISFIVTPEPVPELEKLQKPEGWTTADLDSFLARWRSQAKRVYDSTSGAVPTLAEVAAGKDGTRLLTEHDPAPQTIYSISNRPGEPVVVEVKLRISD